MDAHTVIEEWETSPFDGGYDGLRDLRARRFSGAVEVGTAWLFFSDGDPLGVVEDLEVDPRPGEIDAFEGSSGQLHEASHPAAASLAAMLALDGDVRGQYYTEDTPLSTVHETLSGGGFTGYVELSENVLSGDYYVVYRDGDEDYLGVLGSSQRLITDDEAQSKAEGEIGIYSVVAVRLPGVEIPEAESPPADDGVDSGASAGGAMGAGAATGTGDPDEQPGGSSDAAPAGGESTADEASESSSSEASETGDVPDPESGPVAGTDAGTVDAGGEGAESVDAGRDDDPSDADSVPEPGVGDASEQASPREQKVESERESGPEPGPEPESEAEPEPESEPEPGSEAEADDRPAANEGGMITDPRSAPGSKSEPENGAELASGAEPTPGDPVGRDGATEDEAADGPGEDPAAVDDDRKSPGGFEGSPTDAEESPAEGRSGGKDSVMDGVTSRSVPSLDPEQTGRATSDSTDPEEVAGSAAADAATGTAPTDAEEGDAEEGDAEASSGAASPTGAEPEPDRAPRSDEPSDEPSDDGSESDPETAERVEAVREEYESRIESLETELRSLREERDRLQRRVAELESGGADSATPSGGSLSPTEALAGTSLFVREGTAGEATLEDAHAGRADQASIASNLRIEYHTQFDDDGVTVDGDTFEAWLRSSASYDFVEWLVTELLFEIQSTGTKSALRHLYDAIPDVDRIAFDDVVTVGDGQAGREIGFDVVARNRMGEPLVVANIDEGREPTRADALEPLVADAEDVATEEGSLVAAFSVTSSFFEPDALDVAREATSGSLLSREKYRSYVKLTRKTGFHLCLVESREESFHLAVPEL